MRKLLSLLAVTLCCTSCIVFKPQKSQEVKPETFIEYNTDTLKSTDVTYRVSGEPTVSVYVDDSVENIKFNTSWFLVHEDWLKTFNENQNYIIESSNKDSKTVKNYNKIVLFGCLLLSMFIVIYNFWRATKQ